jgi:hypothetical protein
LFASHSLKFSDEISELRSSLASERHAQDFAR